MSTQSPSVSSSEPLSIPIAIPVPGRPALAGVLDLPSAAGRRPIVVVAHGFKGFLEWGFFPPLTQLLVARGFAVLRFNFTGTGMAPGDERVTDEGAFRKATIGGDVEDLEAVLRHVIDGATEGAAEDPALGRIDGQRLGLVGHSRGGGAAVLAAAGGAGSKVKALVTWAAVASFHRYDEEAVARWHREGSIDVVNGRTGQQLAVDVTMLEELERRGAELEPASAAARVEAPWLILHGGADEVVHVDDARRLDREAGAHGPRRELVILEGAGHTFGARHPFAGPTPYLIELFNHTQVWLRRHLGAS